MDTQPKNLKQTISYDGKYNTNKLARTKARLDKLYLYLCLLHLPHTLFLRNINRDLEKNIQKQCVPKMYLTKLEKCIKTFKWAFSWQFCNNRI